MSRRVLSFSLSVTFATAHAMQGPLGGWDSMLAGRHEEARESLQSNLSRDSGSARDAIGLAALLDLRGDAAGAAVALATALQQDASSPLAAGIVARLAQLAARLPDGGSGLIAVLEPIAAPTSMVADPEVRSIAQELLDEIRRRIGLQSTSSPVVAPGTDRLTQWSLLGPYGRFDRLALWQPQAPENGDTDPSDDPAGSAGQKPFRLDTAVPDGKLVVPLAFHNFGVVYALTQFELPTASVVRLRAASPVSFRVFVDGKELLTADRVGQRPALALSTQRQLSAGKHQVMVKLSNAQRFAWLTLGVTPQAKLLPPGVSIDGPYDLSTLDDPAATLAAAWWLRTRGLDREAGAVMEAALARWPEAPLFAALLGEHYRDAQTGSAAEEDFARARTLLERAIAADPTWLRPRLLVAEMDEGASRAQEAWDSAEKILAIEPNHPDALKLKARIAIKRQWNVEARQAIEAAGQAAPDREDLLADSIEIYQRIGATEALRSGLAELVRRNPDNDDWADRLSSEEDLDASLAAWDRVLALRPTHIYAALARTRVLIDAGQVETALQQLDALGQRFPYEGLVQYRRAAALTLLGRDSEADAALKRALELEPQRIELRETLTRRGERDPLAPYVEDATKIIQTASPAAEEVDSALLADISVVEVDAQGGQTELYQGVHKVYTRAGVEHEGELKPLPNARIESLRLHKADGRIVDVEPTHRPLNLPGLEPGDAIEYIWRRYTPPLEPIPGALDNATVWLFQNDDRAYALSRYVVVHDDALKVSICGNTRGIESKEKLDEGRRVHDYVGRQLPILRLEPHVADRMEVTPHVRLAMNATWQDFGDLIRSAVAGTMIADPPLPALADEVRRRSGSKDPLALARAIHSVVSEKIRPGRQALMLGTPGSVNASSGEGNRITIALALAKLLGLDGRLVLTRPVDRKGREMDCPNPQVFGFALGAIAIGDKRYYLDYSDGDHPFDSFPNQMSESDALEVPLDPKLPVAIVDLPKREAGILRESDADLTLGAGGDVAGTLKITLRGGFASYFRRLLGELPAERLELVWQSLANDAFPGSVVTSHAVEGETTIERDLLLTLTLQGGRFGRATSDGLALPLVTDPSNILGEFASLPTRQTPLLVDADAYRRDRVRLTIPAGWVSAAPPSAVSLDTDFGSYALTVTLDSNRVLIERNVSLPTRRIEPSDYQDFREFAQAIDDAERRELALSR